MKNQTTLKIIKSRMLLSGIDGRTMAGRLGMTPVTFSRKLHEDGGVFDLRELKLIIKILNLSDMEIVEILRR